MKVTTEQEIDYVYNSIVFKTQDLLGFNPKVFLVYYQYSRQYVEIDTLQEYKNKILKKE